MIKDIIIDGKQYRMASSAFTTFKYKDMTGRDMYSDLKKLQTKKGDDMGRMMQFFEVLADVAYVMYTEGDSNAPSKENWLRGISNLMENPEWINEVIALAMSPFRGRNQTSFR